MPSSCEGLPAADLPARLNHKRFPFLIEGLRTYIERQSLEQAFPSPADAVGYGTFNAGDVVTIPPGHDAEVPGPEACVMVDFGEIGDYAKRG
jgi:hypothetical protein